MGTRYYLGCPVWQSDAWRGSLFPRRAARSESLRYYATAFDTVEGNSTFYAIPEQAVVRRWVEQTGDDFRFALKFPRVISHEQLLVGMTDELRQFLSCLEILAEGRRLGPTFLQLPPTFDRTGFARLDAFLKSLPTTFPFAVELRHRDYFFGKWADAVDELLRSLSMDRVMFDSRPLFCQPPSDEHEVISQQRKPRSPIRLVTTGRHPLLRLVGRDDVSLAQPWIEEWADQVVHWIQAGLVPFVFTHAPDDAFAPEMARRFHAAVQRRLVDLPALPDWPGEAEPRQQRLFD